MTRLNYYILCPGRGNKKIDPLFLTASGVSVSEPWVYRIYYSIIGLFLVCSFVIGKRAGCHTFCRMASFMIIEKRL